MFTVLIADDHEIFRRGLISVLSREENIQLVGQASDGREAIEKTEKLKPDVILMDIFMPVCSGLDATCVLQQRLPETKVLMLTISENEEDLFAAIRAGAMGYVLKGVGRQELVAAVNSVARGEAIVSPFMAAKLLREFKEIAVDRGREGKFGITEREKEVLRLVGQGYSNKEIAAKLFISETTAKAHLKKILEKLQLKNRSQVAAYAAEKGLLSANKPVP